MKNAAILLIGSLYCCLAFSLGCGSTGSNSTSSPQRGAAALTIASIAPASLAAGTDTTTITVSGAGFTPSTVIQVNGISEPTTYVANTQISAVLAAAQLAAGGLLPVVALDGANSSAFASPITLQITNPVPAISLIQPSPLLVGAPATPVTISGTGFVPGSSVLVDGTAAATTFIGSTQASVVVPASRLTGTGSIVFQVSNAAPGGGTTTPSEIAIVAPTPTPTITAVTPSSIGRGSLDPLIQITGQNYTADSTAVWNGTPLVTRSVTPTQLLVIVPSALLSTNGTATVVIDNSTSLQPNSNAASVAVVDPFIPELDLIAPKTAPFNTGFTLQILGKYFQSTSTVLVNGVPASVTSASDTGLYVSVPAEATRRPGVYQVTVTTPSPGGGTSQAQTLTAYAPQSNRHMVYNRATGLMYLSVAGSQGLSPSANSVVSFDPLTGTFGTPILVGSEPNQLALSSDGSTLWVGLDGASAVRQVDLTHGVAAYQFSVVGAGAAPLTVSSLSALPGSPDSVIVGSSNDSGFSGLAITTTVLCGAASSRFPTLQKCCRSTARRIA